VEQSLVGVYLVSGDRFLYVNQTLADFYGYTREELMGSVVRMDLVHPDDRALVEANTRLVSRGGLKPSGTRPARSGRTAASSTAKCSAEPSSGRASPPSSAR